MQAIDVLNQSLQKEELDIRHPFKLCPNLCLDVRGLSQGNGDCAKAASCQDGVWYRHRQPAYTKLIEDYRHQPQGPGHYIQLIC